MHGLVLLWLVSILMAVAVLRWAGLLDSHPAPAPLWALGGPCLLALLARHVMLSAARYQAPSYIHAWLTTTAAHSTRKQDQISFFLDRHTLLLYVLRLPNHAQKSLEILPERDQHLPLAFLQNLHNPNVVSEARRAPRRPHHSPTYKKWASYVQCVQAGEWARWE